MRWEWVGPLDNQKRRLKVLHPDEDTIGEIAAALGDAGLCTYSCAAKEGRWNGGNPWSGPRHRLLVSTFSEGA